MFSYLPSNEQLEFVTKKFKVEGEDEKKKREGRGGERAGGRRGEEGEWGWEKKNDKNKNSINLKTTKQKTKKPQKTKPVWNLYAEHYKYT